MAGLRAFTYRSSAIAALCSTVAVQRGTRQVHHRKFKIPTMSCGCSLYRTQSPMDTNWNLMPRQRRSRGLEGRRTPTFNCGYSARAKDWDAEQTPYETLEIARDADEDEIKSSYRRMVKQYHPDVYHETTGGLGEGETPEARFIRIQAAYELLMNKNQRRQYDVEHRVNPMQASKAWMDWVLKKKKAFEQRGDMAASVWAEQQQREMSLKARRLAKHKMDPEEERRILAKEKMAAIKNFETTLSRHTLVLKKRDLVRRRDAEDAKKKLVQQLLAVEGLELDDDDFQN